MRCTWRRFCVDGFRATRERCRTVVPACASPSTPTPSTRVIEAAAGLLNACSAWRWTEATEAATAPSWPAESGDRDPGRSPVIRPAADRPRASLAAVLAARGRWGSTSAGTSGGSAGRTPRRERVVGVVVRHVRQLERRDVDHHDVPGLL